jgi:hypothetical protein
MLRTTDILAKLKELVELTELFKDVRVVPLSIFRQEDIFSALGDLQAPAALICFRGHVDDRDGNLITRRRRISLVTLVADAAGKAGESGQTLVDDLQAVATLWGVNILDDMAQIRADYDLTIAPDPEGQYHVAEFQPEVWEEIDLA